MNSSKGLVKQILTIIFAVALLSAFIGFIGLILLNFRFESYYYNLENTSGYYELLSHYGLEEKFRTCFIVLICLMSLSLILVVLSLILSNISYKNSGKKTTAKILNIVYMALIVISVLVEMIIVINLSSYISVLDLDLRVHITETLFIHSCYESILSQSMAALVPMFVTGSLGLAYFISKIIKRKDDQNIDVVSENE